jgi:hypothetical protein
MVGRFLAVDESRHRTMVTSVNESVPSATACECQSSPSSLNMPLQMSLRVASHSFLDPFYSHALLLWIGTIDEGSLGMLQRRIWQFINQSVQLFSKVGHDKYNSRICVALHGFQATCGQLA